MNSNLALDCEVLIVGAGPAGASVAYYLAKAGRKVILVDRQTFPRDKVCGDFVGPAAIRELQGLGITKLTEFQKTNTINKAAIYLDGKQLLVTDFPTLPDVQEKARVIPRKLLDSWILAAAKKAGAKVREKTLVLSYKVMPSHVEVTAKTADDTQTIKAQLLIGADGTNSVIANQLNGHQPPKTNRIIGVRTYVRNIQGPVDQADMYFSSHSFPGYCWFFPTTQGEANIGVGTLLETNPPTDPKTKEMFYQLIAEDAGLKSRIANADFNSYDLQAWPLKTYDSKMALTEDRLMLVGEAAGLVNPLNGEGIQYALMSGRWASQTAIAALDSGDFTQTTLSAYAKRVEDELGYGFRTSAMVIQLIRNRNLNPMWLKIFEAMVAAANSNPSYAQTAGSILAGTMPTSSGLNPAFLLSTVQQIAMESTIKIADEAIQDPATLPINVIKIGQATLQTALETAQNPLGFLQWGLQTGLSAFEFAAAATNVVAARQSLE